MNNNPNPVDDLIARSDKDGVAVLTLNVPKSINALSDRMLASLSSSLVELTSGASAYEEELLSHAKSKLSLFQRPKKIIFGELPKSTTGKIRKNALRDQLRDLG